MKRRYWVKRILSGLAFCLGAVGCGDGITGDLPPVTGQVYRADTEGFVPHAEVTLVTDEGQQFSTRTDEEGRFSFRNVPRGGYTLFVAPPSEVAPASLDAQEIRFADRTDFVAVSLPPTPTGGPPGSPSQVTIEPEQRIVFLEPRPETVRFIVHIVGENGGERRPHWLVRGDIGRIDSQGVFTPTQVGTGWVIARVGDLEAIAVVRVEKSPPPGASWVPR